MLEFVPQQGGGMEIKMDQVKTGKLIRQFRTQMGLTQKELAARINISDKAVSKWERGNGYPDISLLAALADVFCTDIHVLITGVSEKNEKGINNMKNIKFYVCEKCGNIITSTMDASIICCGSKLSALEPKKAEKSDMLKTEDIGGEWFVSSNHEMTKEHYISFAAYTNGSTAMLFKQYPEWNMQFTLPLYRSGRLVWYCTRCGLLYQDVALNSSKS